MDWSWWLRIIQFANTKQQDMTRPNLFVFMKEWVQLEPQNVLCTIIDAQCLHIGQSLLAWSNIPEGHASQEVIIPVTPCLPLLQVCVSLWPRFVGKPTLLPQLPIFRQSHVLPHRQIVAWHILRANNWVHTPKDVRREQRGTDFCRERTRA